MKLPVLPPLGSFSHQTTSVVGVQNMPEGIQLIVTAIVWKPPIQLIDQDLSIVLAKRFRMICANLLQVTLKVDQQGDDIVDGWFLVTRHHF